MLDAVPGVDADVVAAPDPPALQEMGQPVGVGLDLGVRRLVVAGLDGEPLWDDVDGVLEEVSDVQGHTPETRTRSCFWLASFPMTDTPSGAEPHCLVELVDHTLVVTMNRPEKRNALSGEMLEIMSEAWDRVNSDDAVRVAILTGAGGSFCAGADLAAMSKSAPTDRFESGEFDPSRDQVAAQGLPAHQAAGRGGRGPGHRGRHRDPAGHRHPGGRRVRPVRGLRAALGSLPARRLRRAAPPPDPLHGGGRPAAHRPAHQGPGGPVARPDRARRTRRTGAGEGARDRRA